MRLSLAASGAIAIALASCCASPGGPPASIPPTNVAAVVEMTEAPDFVPSQVTVLVGDTVLWHNSSRFGHTVTFDPSDADDPGAVRLPAGVAPFDSGRIAPGGSYWHSFTVPGTYYYVCEPHEEFGMEGVVTVKPKS